MTSFNNWKLKENAKTENVELNNWWLMKIEKEVKPEGPCSMEMIRPPIQGTTLRTQSPLFNWTGVLESSSPLCPGTSSISGILFELSAINKQFIRNVVVIITVPSSRMCLYGIYSSDYHNTVRIKLFLSATAHILYINTT